MNINSDYIKVYPLTSDYTDITSDDGTITFTENTSKYRYLETRNIEQNIVSKYNNIIDNKSFIICDNINNIIYFKDRILYLNPLKVCINGYIFEIKQLLKISLLSYDFTSDKTWYIYFKIELENKPITYQSTQLSNYVLKGIDINNIYNGLSLEIKESSDFIENEEDNNIYKLIIGKVKKVNQDLIFNYNKNLITKVNIDNMSIDIDDSSVSEQNYNGLVQSWLNNYFIIDDGKVGGNT